MTKKEHPDIIKSHSTKEDKIKKRNIEVNLFN